jgi:hypothetical protein
MKTPLIPAACLLGTWLAAGPAYAQPTGSEAVSPTYHFDLTVNLDSVDVASLSEDAGKNYALLIGVSDYEDGSILDLKGPVRHAENLRTVLCTYYTFDPDPAYTMLLKNPRKTEVIHALEDLDAKMTDKDNLLIFFAGHGVYNESLRLGYWLTTEANKNDPASLLSNSTLRDYVKGIKARHILLITDACFSGSIFNVRNAFSNAPRSIQQMYAEKSRKAMSSGALKPVPDESVFAEYIVKRLTQNTTPFLPSEWLFFSLKSYVSDHSPNGQLPQYGIISGAEDEGGDFIFVRKK